MRLILIVKSVTESSESNTDADLDNQQGGRSGCKPRTRFRVRPYRTNWHRHHPILSTGASTTDKNS